MSIDLRKDYEKIVEDHYVGWNSVCHTFECLETNRLINDLLIINLCFLGGSQLAMCRPD